MVLVDAAAEGGIFDWQFLIDLNEVDGKVVREWRFAFGNPG